ncbi:hypothetical protein NM208_g1170 [Fusarium decemcellulare]|uniref:Uncharacterized protein n=1 Tax=Fusarium decemcellulare TaxID=57161 RepID=A0ACC1SWR5_9HYPO|nr:hypothetical protein NM208_g1170 [Fusarium decemcellulare]
MTSRAVEETTPLLAGADRAQHDTFNRESLNKVDFDPHGDPEDPLEWSAPLRWRIVALLALTSFMVTFNCISVVPVASHIANDLSGGSGTKSAAVTLVTIWELGEAVGPLLIAPLSEMFGRWPLMNVCTILLVMATMLSVVSQTTLQLIMSRALTGMAVATNVLGPAIVGDMFAPDQRGTAMSLMMLAPLVGGAVGPALSGTVSQSLGWRSVLWVSVVLASCCELLLFTCFRETYKVSILRQKAERLPNQVANTSIPCEIAKGPGLDKGHGGLGSSMMRPAEVLFSSGVLAAMSLFGSVVFSYFYVVAVTLPNILEDLYGLSPAATGSAFFANGMPGTDALTILGALAKLSLSALGSLVGILFCRASVDKIYIKLRAANNGIGLPEYRLPISIMGSLTLAPAVVLYGWCAEYKLSLSLVLLSVIWIRLSLMLAFLPIMAYVVDACGLYSASALTGVIVIRCLAGAFLPLLMAMLIERVGYGWGFTAFGTLSLVLTGIPALILRYGPIWRQGCKYTRTETE